MAEKKSRSTEWSKQLEKDFLEAYQEYSDALYRHCVIRVRDKEIAKDIVQETFSRTWLYLSKGKKVDYIRAFLYRIANNLIVDGSRKKKTASLESMMEEDNFEPRDESIREPVDHQAIAQVMKHLHALDEIYRVVITMRFIDELSPKEIAQALGVSENVVSVRIYRGMVHLRAQMSQKMGS